MDDAGVVRSFESFCDLPCNRERVINRHRPASKAFREGNASMQAGDLAKAFEKEGLAGGREARLSAWHVAHRFMRQK